MSFVRKLLRGFRPDPRGQEIEALRRRIKTLEHAADADAAQWKETRGRLKGATDRMKAVAASLGRRMLSGDVVQELLPLRARTIGARAAHAGADRYDAMLQEISPAYRKALTDAAHPHPDLATTDLQGFTWWVPVPASLSGATRERFITEQQFPYRAITETREFAVGPVLLDIGANIGLMSIPRVVLGDVGRAYCAEPDPLNFTALVRNIASSGLRGLVLPDQVAIGEASAPVRLRHGKYPGGHRVVPSGVTRDGTIEVPCFTLDDWCRRLAIDPELVAYIKVDAQGSEVGVLRGAATLLTYPHIAWQIEVHPVMLDAAGTPPDVLYRLCAGHFTHFIDLDKLAQGPRARRTQDLPDALAYIIGRKRPTDIILFNAGERLDRRMDRWAKRWM
jgi:FkbM family methyltransferase